MGYQEYGRMALRGINNNKKAFAIGTTGIVLISLGAGSLCLLTICCLLAIIYYSLKSKDKK